MCAMRTRIGAIEGEFLRHRCWKCPLAKADWKSSWRGPTDANDRCGQPTLEGDLQTLAGNLQHEWWIWTAREALIFWSKKAMPPRSLSRLADRFLRSSALPAARDPRPRVCRSS